MNPVLTNGVPAHAQAPVPALAGPEAARGSVWGALALGLGAAGSYVVRSSPGMGLLAFVLAGLALAWSTTGSPGRAYGAGPWGRAEREAWEIPFLVLLAAGLALVRFYKLGDLPAGAHGHEGEMASQLQDLIDAPYTGHVGNDDILWPSMAFYQAIASIKLLGYSAFALRLPSAIFAYAAALGMYFLARRVSSPFSAAVVSVLFAGNVLMVSVARNLFPGALLILGCVLALYYCVKAVDDRKAGSFALAGFGLGLCLHGFVPGRDYFGLFLGWFLCLAVLYPKLAPSRRMQLVFWGATLLTALPVVWWAAFNWAHYWQYVRENNPWASQGAFGYVKGFFEVLPTYARAFHVAGDPASVDVIPGKPLLDSMSGLLFAVGLFGCVALFWRPLPLLVLGGLLLGLLPAILGGGFAHPTSRRCILALPHVYLIAALGLEQIQSSLQPWLGKAKVLAALAVLALAVWFHVGNLKAYEAFLNQPDTRGIFDYKGYLTGQSMRAHPQSQLHTSLILLEGVQVPMLVPKERNWGLSVGYEGMLSFVPEPGKDQLFLMDSVNLAWMGLFKRIYPSARVTVHDVPGLPAGMSLRSDPSVPDTYMVEAEVPAKEAGNLRGLLLSGPKGELTKLDAFDPDFGSAQRGRRLTLKGCLNGGHLGTEIQGTVDWAGWRLRVDGVELKPGVTAKLPAGVLRLELEGTVPKDAQGPLPLKLMVDNQDLVAMGRVLAYSGPEVSTSMTAGERTWGAAQTVERRDLVPLRRFIDITEEPVPFSARMRFRFAVPEDGDYEFHEFPYSDPVGSITLNKKVVFDRLKGGDEKAVLIPMHLAKGAPVSAVMDYVVPTTGDSSRTLALYVRKAGETKWNFLPYEWLLP